MLSKKLNIQEEKKFFVVVHNGSPIFKITKDIESVVHFLGGLSSSEVEVTVKKKTKKKKTKKEEKNKERIVKAKQLEKAYRKSKAKFYKRSIDRVKEIKPNFSEFVHFEKAVDIVERNETKIKVFMKAQIEGLKFVGGGTGTFPKVNQLSTDGAEQRVLEYLRKQNLETVELTEQEKTTDLLQNRKYKMLHRKIKNGDANLMEALYVRECQIARRGETQKMVEEYIQQLKK